MEGINKLLGTYNKGIAKLEEMMQKMASIKAWAASLTDAEKIKATKEPIAELEKAIAGMDGLLSRHRALLIILGCKEVKDD